MASSISREFHPMRSRQCSGRRAQRGQLHCMLMPLSECQWTQDNINLNSHAFVTAGHGALSPITTDYVGAAINPAGTLGMAYCPKAVTITADLGKFSAPVRARWFDPTNGAFTAIDDAPLPNRGAHEFSTPGLNIANAEDWVLVLETTPAARGAASTPSPP